MTHDYNISHTAKTGALHRALLLVICLIASLTNTNLWAQTIGGNVFGGGNAGNVGASSTVELYDGTIQGSVYGAGYGSSTTVGGDVTMTIGKSGASTGVTVNGDVYGGGAEGQVARSISIIVNTATIKGNLYGGGYGADAIVTGNTAVTMSGGTIKNIFGGGNAALLNGQSSVTITGGAIGYTETIDDIEVLQGGNVFGGGNMAGVEQYTSVTISGGELNNNVYGAGNQGDVGQSSTVTLKGGTIKGNVYGGARMANVGEYSFVNIDGANATSSLIVRSVYGGNDIAGTIGNKSEQWSLPDSITNLGFTSGNTFIYASQNTQHPVIIGSLYGGGNGDYTYTDAPNNNNNKFNVVIGNETFEVNNKPELKNTYIKLLGGIYGHIYGGGNKATIAESTSIHLENKLDENTLNSIPKENAEFLGLTKDVDYTENGQNIVFSYHVSRMFGGNNLAEMSIRPTWNLIAGRINNLYSGGNKGKMTAEDGISLTLANAGLTVNNVYGGCRMADVQPSSMADQNGYAAHVRIDAGTINNVYGGNDISGKVNYGTKVEIFSSITGDVYGGGNGSYAYTDKIENSDYYYETPQGSSSINALFNFRPHIEKTLIHIAGNANNPVTIGNVYCGGNSATLYKDGDGNASATLNIGNNATIENLFLGSNGEKMIGENMLAKYADDNYNTINLTNKDELKRYMDGVAVDIVPTIRWEDGLNNTTIGSFFCGGNVGSMTYAGVAPMIFPAGLVITDKIVAGCNNANVTVGNYTYVGGLTGAADNGNKVNITINSTLKPTLVDDLYTKANIYGGCYNSGKVNGNVEININSDIIASDLDQDILANSGNSLNSSTLSIYGGGYGVGTEIQGNTTINLTNNACILKVFGGGEMGTVTGDTEVNLAQDLPTKDTNGNIIYNAHKVYAGGFEGRVGGNTTLNLYGGSIKSAFAGACNANIGGATQAIIGAGSPGIPYVAEAVYGGNDFGGTIEGSKLYDNITVSNVTKNVRSQTYVKYVSGKIGRAIYGGSYGSYEYDNSFAEENWPTIKKDKTTLVSSDNNDPDPIGTIQTNTFVDIASTSISADDIIGSDKTNENDILTMIAGGGRGYKGLPQYVEVGQTYLLLHGKDYANRDEKLMAHRVYGGGNLSKVNNTLIDAYSGSFGQIFGGTHGVKTTNVGDLKASYDCTNTTINYYGSMGKADMNLFGTGANSGATDTATINLYAGNVGNVYGGSLAEGYTAVTNVNVPNTSTIKANAIFGGALGESEGRPCDVGVSNITFSSATATVENIIKEVINEDGTKEVTYGGIYGGNHTARATKETNVTINVPVRDKYENLIPIFGAGYGAATVAGSTHITLKAEAKVANVYGGGRNGKVFNAYNNYDQSQAFNGYADNDRRASWQISNYDLNTSIKIHGGPRPANDREEPFVDKAHVTGNVYGAGYGSGANTCGKTEVQLLGGTVDGDIYGGGFEGSMLSLDNSKDYDVNISSLCVIDGGQVRNVFGGGYKGNIEGNSGVNIGSKTGNTFYAGVPTILRSAYGGGEMAKVSGTSTVNMYNGYVGYRYVNGNYQPELELNYVAEDEVEAVDDTAGGAEGESGSDTEGETDNNTRLQLLKENGNLYGAGFGEGAVVMNTVVNLYGGIVRNGVYGGGEIAAVGDGTYDTDTKKYTITQGGETHVKMYGGLVEGDVFGGGRGFSYNENGNQVIGEELYSDGYVFGKTKVEIYRGTIGTDASVAEGHGNVFGGGNIGYVYSAGVKYTGDTDDTDDNKIKGHYYTDNDYTTRTEDCCVRIVAGSLVKNEFTYDGISYPKGTFLENDFLNTLEYNASIWDNLDTLGVTIRNAVFAGGNVSAGSDRIYANAVTVFGNATASVVDVFNRDLITLGGEHVGGLYGDGNLTFVDGYRELNITNYGTDYYRLKKEISDNTYKNIKSERIKAYYTKQGENWVINTTSGRTMNTIQRADFCGVFGSRFLLHGAQDRVPDVVDYTNYTINRVGEVSLNTKTVEGTTHGNYFGIYNVVNELGALTSNVEFNNKDVYPHQYLSFEMDDAGNILGTTTITNEDQSYLDYKKTHISDGQKNIAISPNMVALASGVYLELLYTNPETQQKEYGPITGVIELDLINVQPGEGGGYVYAKNEHGSPKPVDTNTKKQLTLSTANEGAITQRAFTYEQNSQNLVGYQTSGNFVHASNTIIDNCFNDNVHYWYVSGTIYVYDQKISAYTGAVDTRQQSLNIPLNINSTIYKNIRIIGIHPNKYFVGSKDVTSITFGNKVYQLNDPISYWDYNQLPDGQDLEEYFVDMTYIAQEKIWKTEDLTKPSSYNKGDVIASTIYESEDFPQNFYINNNGVATPINKDEVFRITNEMSHENGYMLTFEMTNPKKWDTYYTNCDETVLGSDLQNTTGYKKAPTIKCLKKGIYGQKNYNVENLINDIDYQKHQSISTYINEDIKNLQATFEPAYYVKESLSIDGAHYNAGSYIAKSKISEALQEKFGQAYICISTIEVTEKEFILNGDWISGDQYTELRGFQYAFSPAYVCTNAGLYGGVYYTEGENLTAEEFCDLPFAERNKKMNNGTAVFTFNHDALDVFETTRDERYNSSEQVTATPKQTATLYVPRESNIENLSKDRIISVILEYVGNDETPEKHVVNIHIEFKTGQPSIGSINPPATVLPNTIVGLSTPTVTRGAYEIIGGGWEIFKNEADARAHKNGEPYINNTTPMYWYQDGYHVAYYAKTYLGKTYSNPVKFSVANYHRLGEVMNHKVLNEEGEEVNEYMYIDHEDVKRAPKIYIDAAGSEEATKNDLDYLAELYAASLDATNLDVRVKGCDNLEFILRSDIAPKAAWTAVGTEETDGTEKTPFAGNLHGNGYTISGLGDASLFEHLGGKVYNLGVNGGNVASTVAEGGRIENVWVSATTPIELSGTNVVNYYFRDADNDADNDADFEKGKITHTLNSFYANRNTYNANGYVEKYFDDGDFIYANGTIPLTSDERLVNGQYRPLADDYIFFGQRLIYGDGHESLPSRIIKNGNNIDPTDNGNRVYSAPAYFMSSTPSQVYFNTAAKFVDSYNGMPIHHNLTAIDFTGSDENDTDDTKTLLDFGKLSNFALGDTEEQRLTKNLLVYAKEETDANNPLYANMSEYLKEPTLDVPTKGYKIIAQNNNTGVRGHLVTKQISGDYVAKTDHFLVDKENFNVPITYKFIEPKDDNPGTRMWYQRTPDRFANGDNAGWDIICLPFTAQLVTTHQKGEITHFYGDSKTMHEYWLRQLSEVIKTTDGDASTTTASFTLPAAVANGPTYTATNTYLYKTYYENMNDGNGDQYQQNYYKNNQRQYPGYAYLQANTPYIIAFPGATYKEFDMSGNLSDKDDLTAQVVTMVSAAGAEISATSEIKTQPINGYSLVGTFQATPITNGYLINSEGNAFEMAQSSQSTAQSSQLTAQTVPFRGYLVKTASQSGAPKRIFIGGETEEVEEEPKEDIIERGLTIYTKKEAIHIESTLEHEAAVVIYSTSGQIIAKVKVQPMSKEVVEVPQGIYIINKRKVMVM